MGSANGHPLPKYSVSLTGLADTELARIGAGVASFEAGKLLRNAYRSLLSRLSIDADHMGEPLYHIKSMKMTIRCTIVIPLYIEYGIHDTQPIVVIRRVVALSDPIL